MSGSIDDIVLSKTVMFVGDYFTLMTTVVLVESLREEGEDDEDFAIRLGAVFIKEHYGWDVLAVSNDIAIVEDEEEDFEED
jgi:hypothetical protein